MIAPFYYQNLVSTLAPQKQANGSLGWALPLDPKVRCIHMGDIRELGNIVAGAFTHPDESGNGEYLPLVGDFMSFNGIVETLNRQGHTFTFNQVPPEVFATLFPGAAEIAETFKYSKLTHTWVRIRLIESRSQTKLLAGHRAVVGVGASELFGAGRVGSSLNASTFGASAEGVGRDDDVSTCTLGRCIGSC